MIVEAQRLPALRSCGSERNPDYLGIIWEITDDK